MTPQFLELANNVAAISTGAAQQWNGGVATLAVQAGNFNGCTASLQTLGADGLTWVAVGASTTVTAAAAVTGIYLPAGPYRVVVSNAAPTALYASLTASLN
ncbi:MAG: hypothetical protein KGL39_32240 [Patescibacteria group bacterium]|nr:hypothetical protein [Patescibacteria group bacterium]